MRRYTIGLPSWSTPKLPFTNTPVQPDRTNTSPKEQRPNTTPEPTKRPDTTAKPPINEKPSVVKTPTPEWKVVTKSNGETQHLSSTGDVREKSTVDQKTGIKQTEHIAPTGRVVKTETQELNGTKQITHYDLGREQKAEVIHQNGTKETTDVHYNRYGKERARETVTVNASGAPVSKTVVRNITINNTVIKTENHYAVGRYGFVYQPVVVRPVVFVADPYWYTPAGVVIAHPFRYSWEFRSDPWYSYHATYWEPYPVYPSPSYWVTDWMVAGYVADRHAVSVSVEQTRIEANLAREDAAKARMVAERAADAAERAEAQTAQAAAEARVARAEARAAKAEVAEARGKEMAGKPNTKATPIDRDTKEALQTQIANTITAKKGDNGILPDLSKALADPKHIYPVSKNISVPRADDGKAAGVLTSGDLLKLEPGQEIPKDAGENTFVTMRVMTSKGEDDSVPAGTLISVPLKDVQEFDNEFRAKLDVGLSEADKNQDAFKNGKI